MAEKEIPVALSSLYEALLAYQDTQEGLGRVRSVAESIWGDQWRTQLPSVVADCPAESQAKIKANLERALTYEKAGSVWTEVSKLADPRRPIDVAQVKAQLPEMQRWLAIFGKAGTDLLAKLSKKIADAEANPAPSAAVTKDGASNPYGLTIEQLWNFDHFMRLKSYYDQTISRTSARCVHLGGLELSQYPYYGYILDLLDEILTYGMEILTPPYTAIVRDRYKGGDAALRKVLLEFKKEFEDNAPPEMLSEEEESLEEIKNRLGSLASKSEPEGDIGPAPDGFDPSEEPESQPQPQPAAVQAGAPAVRKMPVKAPVAMKAPVKRPGAPAGSNT